MTFAAFIAILPIILTAGASVAVMLGIAFERSHAQTVRLSLIGLGLAILSLPIAGLLAPIQATPLIIIDDYALFFIGLILSTGVVVTLLFSDYFGQGDSEDEEIYLLLLTAVLGAVVLVASRHFATLFLGLETMSVSLFAMIAYTVRKEMALESGVKYLILSGVSSGFLLFGSALVYAELGTFEFDQMSVLADSANWSPMVIVGLTMAVSGLAFKLSLVPFHLWTSDVYQGAPAPVTAFVATVSKGAIFALLLRYFVSADALHNFPVVIVFTILALLSILVGNLLALLQDDLKRLFAYSSIAHMGYLLIPFVAGAVIGKQLLIESVAFYLVAYFITTLGAFGMISALSNADREFTHIEDLKGLFWEKPLLAAAFTTMLLSLAGIPLTAGFIAKFYIFASGVQGAMWLLIFTLVLGSGIGLYYYLRVVMVMMKSPDTSSEPAEPRQIAQSGQLVLVGLMLLLIYLGVNPGPLTEVITGLG